MSALKLTPSPQPSHPLHTLRPRVAVEVGIRAAEPMRPLPGQPGMLFFGGSRRSGTTWVTGMLNAHPRIECRNEGWIFNDRGCSLPDWLNEKAIRAWADSPEARGTWLKDQTIDEAILAMRRAMLQALYRQAIAREGWKVYEDLRWVGDKTTLHFCTSADAIHAYFPDARFLHMLRDGRDVVVSDMFLYLRDAGFDDLSARGRRRCELAVAHFLHGRGPAMPLFDAEVLTKLAGDWARSVAGGQRARELFGPAFYQIRYESLVEDPRRIRSALEWLEVESHDDMVEHMVALGDFKRNAGGREPGQEDRAAEWRKGVVGDWRNYFTPADSALFKSLAGALLVELGYEKDLSW